MLIKIRIKIILWPLSTTKQLDSANNVLQKKIISDIAGTKTRKWKVMQQIYAASTFGSPLIAFFNNNL